jgi:hypothetical protein
VVQSNLNRLPRLLTIDKCAANSTAALASSSALEFNPLRARAASEDCRSDAVRLWRDTADPQFEEARGDFDEGRAQSVFSSQEVPTIAAFPPDSDRLWISDNSGLTREYNECVGSLVAEKELYAALARNFLCLAGCTVRDESDLKTVVCLEHLTHGANGRL